MNTLEMQCAPFETRRQLGRKIATLRDVFAKIIADEVVTEKGMNRLHRFYKESQIPNDVLGFVRDEAFRQAAHREIIGQQSQSQETYWVLSLARRLRISPSVLDWMEEEMTTLTLLNHIQDCNFNEIPTTKPESIIVNSMERAFVELPCTLIKESSIKRKYQDGLSGISIRLARGIDYKIGETKSELLIRRGLSTYDEGFLVLTDSQMIYSGANESFSVEIGKLFGTRIFADSIQFSTLEDENVRTIGFKNQLETEYCAVVLSRVLNA